MLYDYVVQLKRYTYACCVIKYFPRYSIIFTFFFFSLSKLSSCLYTNSVHYKIFRLCHIRYNNSWCITYNAWWQILAYSCYWQRYHLISVSIFEYRTATLYATSLIFTTVNRWTDCCLPGCPATYPCNYSIGNP